MSVKNELNDHLDAINRNTNEVQGNYEFLCELENRINKLSERLDNIDFSIFKKNGITKRIHLTPNEQEVFLMIYVKDGVDIEELSKKLAYDKDLIDDIVDNIVLKGVPILKQIHNSSIKLHMDIKFKNMQAKENIVGINNSISKTMPNFL